MARRTLPIGIQTFREVRERDCYYVDKTACIRRLLDKGTHYFLSRPRRFGKSLLLDTCKELFEGNEALFEGLAIHEHWDWSQRHPVVRLDFGSGHFQGPGELRTEVTDRLRAMEDEAGITNTRSTGARASRFTWWRWSSAATPATWWRSRSSRAEPGRAGTRHEARAMSRPVRRRRHPPAAARRPHQRMAPRSITPCSASAFAASRRVASRPISKPGAPLRADLRRQPRR